MRNAFIVFISASLLASIACTSKGGGSITAPSTLPAPVAAPVPAQVGVCTQGNCLFEAVPISEPSSWHGDTMPSHGNVPAMGHPGHLTVKFPASFSFGTMLKWSKFHHGSKAECTITNDVDPTWKYVVPDHCGSGEGELLVQPRTTTRYTFTDTENPEQSQDLWQVATVVVVVPETVDVTATWEPASGFQTDDPTLVYSGAGTGRLSGLAVVLESPAHAHCGLGGRGEYARLTAEMSLDDSARFVGSYDGNPGCVAAQGTFVLTRER